MQPVATQSFRAETDWTSRGLKKECARLKERLLHFGVATPAEIAAYWPGGASNKIAKSPGKWIYCYGEYKRFLGRRSASEVDQPDADHSAADAAVTAAIADAPVPVVRSDSMAPALMVYPKSFVAIGVVESLDDQLAGIEITARNLRSEATPSTLALLDSVAKVEMYLTAVIVWIITSPGPGLPFELFDDDPQPPQEITDISWLDLHAVLRAWRQQSLRLRAIQHLVDREPDAPEGARRMSWAGFFGSYPIEHQQSMMRARSLASLIASTRMHNNAHAPKSASKADTSQAS